MDLKHGLWLVQAILATLYLMAGGWKAAGSAPSLEQMMPGFPLLLIRIVGVAETVAAIGLVIPAVLSDRLAVAGWAGAFLAAESAVFVVVHLAGGVWGPAVATLILGGLSAFVAWGRLKQDEV